MPAGGWAVQVPIGYRIAAWEVTAPLATGSWGSVYAARRSGKDTTAEDRVADRAALKFMPTGTVTPRQLSHLQEMARRETQLHERLIHPRLVHLYETLTVDDPDSPRLDGACVLVMELAAESLGSILVRSPGEPVPDAPRLVVEICEGLAHMHASGWVHGDLKPSNVLLMKDGSIRLADFGLAAELEGTHAYLPPIGSSDFMPPERWAEPLGERGRAVRATADVWALGVTAHQLLSGHLPFPGTTAGARAAAAAEYAAGRRELMLSPELPAGWRAFVEDCLTPGHGGRRQHTAATLLKRARGLLTEPGSAGTMPRAGRVGRRVPLVLAGGLSLAVLAGTGVAVTQAGRDQQPDYSRQLNTRADIPPQYYGLIAEAGTMCKEPGVTPALVAAMLRAESNFDPNLSDPGKDEYGIARWTPRVLQYYLPPTRRGQTPSPPFSPADSIPAVGRYLCRLAPGLESVPGDRPLLLAAAYRTSADTVRREGGIPVKQRPYIDKVRRNLARYQPVRSSAAR